MDINALAQIVSAPTQLNTAPAQPAATGLSYIQPCLEMIHKRACYVILQLSTLVCGYDTLQDSMEFAIHQF